MALLVHALVLIIMLWAAMMPTMAQGYLTQIGTPTFTTAVPVEGGFINVANGNLHLEIPLGGYPQRGGRPFAAALVYDSRIWTISSVPSTAWQPNSQGGWRFVTSGDTGTVTFQSNSNGGHPPTITLSPATWTQSSGTTHLFNVGATVSPCASGSSAAFATDATGYYMNLTNTCVNGSSQLSWTINAPDGTLVNAPSGAGVKDTNGNYLSKDANGNTVDTLAGC